jgi:hypothetical protein
VIPEGDSPVKARGNQVVRRFHLTDISTGASLFLTKNTTNAAGFVALALRPTTRKRMRAHCADESDPKSRQDTLQ